MAFRVLPAPDRPHSLAPAGAIAIRYQMNRNSIAVRGKAATTYALVEVTFPSGADGEAPPFLDEPCHAGVGRDYARRGTRMATSYVCCTSRINTAGPRRLPLSRKSRKERGD